MRTLISSRSTTASVLVTALALVGSLTATNALLTPRHARARGYRLGERVPRDIAAGKGINLAERAPGVAITVTTPAAIAKRDVPITETTRAAAAVGKRDVPIVTTTTAAAGNAKYAKRDDVFDVDAATNFWAGECKNPTKFVKGDASKFDIASCSGLTGKAQDKISKGTAFSHSLNSQTKCQVVIQNQSATKDAQFQREAMVKGLQTIFDGQKNPPSDLAGILCKLEYDGGALEVCISGYGGNCDAAGAAPQSGSVSSVTATKSS